MRRLCLLVLPLVGIGCGEIASHRGESQDAGGVATPIVTDPGGEMPSGCAPGAGATSWWVEEGEELALTVGCTSGLDIPNATFTVTPLPRGAAYDPTTGQLRWIPALDQAGVYHLIIAARNGETGPLRIAVADRFDSASNAPIELGATYTEEMALPVMHLTVDKKLNGDDYTAATVVYRGRTYKAEAKIRGNSSLSYPKKNFTIKFPKGDLFNEPSMAGGFHNKRRFSLVAGFDDNSCLRYRLAYELWNRLGTDRVRVQAYSAVVYLNGAYHGLYTVVDHIDEDLFAAHGLNPRGNVFKSLGPDANFYPKDPISNVYEKKSGLPKEGSPGAFADLIDLTNFAVNAPPEVFRAQIGSRVHLGDWRAWLVLATAISARDSLGKNAFHHHSPGVTPWRVVVWDFNHSFGQDWMTLRESPGWDIDDLASTNRIFDRLMTDPVLGPETRAIYADALTNELALTDVLDTLDSIAEEIAPSAKRDERKWRQHHLTFERWATARTEFTNFEGEVLYMRQWIRDRWAYLGKTLGLPEPPASATAETP